MRADRGILITLEGIDGAGKTTVARMLRKRFPDFVFTREPTDGPLGEMARRASGFEQLFLFMADHANHLRSCILPSINSGEVVVSDRYIDSRVAYQGALLRRTISMEWIYELHRPWSLMPDLTLLFRIDPSVALMRCKNRGATSIFEMEALLRDVSGNFEILASREPERFVIINAEREISEVAERAASEIERFIQQNERQLGS
ncbi:dTMP kinase [Methanothrix thermoacetophila]|uniref:Probable thymidylate kinase n=1 Tax=Methanothrix thermoacetophila (strain DSM 6194 / JCM 14653 / NBRC 101360 / PT) TaxID=349307 RepID=A0B8K1_METTP|nr:dTMP kinase [Methanothrix thermoacetophila]ABK15025.1 thymidylate kinase [Methanothrix thermoacetophila PT]